MEPCEGTVWRHPNLRIAYVAQHAFHHIEQHLDITANQYIQWRYAIGEDREALGKVGHMHYVSTLLRVVCMYHPVLGLEGHCLSAATISGKHKVWLAGMKRQSALQGCVTCCAFQIILKSNFTKSFAVL